MTHAFYEKIDKLWLPQQLSQSPWNPNHQSGVAVAGLMAHSIETHPLQARLDISRLTLSLLCPVPMKEVEIKCQTIREGSRIAMVEAQLLANGKVCAHALGLKARSAQTPASDLPIGDFPPYKLAPERPLRKRDINRSGLEVRLISGGLAELGPGKAWLSPKAPIASDVPMSPVALAAMAADYSGAIGSILDCRVWSFANLDLSIHFVRPPSELQTLVDAETQSAGNGHAIGNSRLFDSHGLFAHAHQTLFVEGLDMAVSQKEATT